MALTNLSQITTSGISTLADINLNNITGVAATFTGNVTVGGTLTYDDVTNIDSVGLVTARSGVSITGGDLTLPDAIIHAGDTNTKIRFPAANTFTVETNGSERFRIESGGNIGIGTDNPNNNLDILDATGDASLRIRGDAAGRDANLLLIASTTGESKISFGDAGSNNRGYILYDHSDDSMGFRANGNERITIRSNGNVGIGSEIPSNKLDVQGSADINSNLIVGGQLRISDQIVHSDDNNTKIRFPAADTFTVETGGNERFRIKSDGGTTASNNLTLDEDGRLLVGTTSTSTPGSVVIQGNSTGSSSYGLLRLTKGSTTPADGDALGLVAFGDGNHNTNAQISSKRDGGTWNSGSSHPTRLEFNTTADGDSGSTERLRIDNVGWLGLNQTSKDNAGQVAAFKNVSNTHSWLNVNVNNNTGVSGVVFGDSDSWSPGYIQYRHSTDDMEIITNNVERLRITSAGLIGINTTPGTLLELKGESSKEATVTFNRSPVQGTNDGVIGEFLFENNTDSVALLAVKRESAADDAYIQFATQSSGGGLTERLRITSGGNLGIGIDPSFPIYTGANDRTLILGTGSEDSAIQIHSGTSNYGGLYFGDATSGSNRYRGYVEFKHGTSDDFLRFGTAATERLRIDSAGNTTLGYAGSSLHFQNGFNNSTARIQNGGGSNSSELKFLVRNAGTESEKMRLTSTAGLAVVTAGSMPANAGNETLYVMGEGHNGHGTSNTRSVVSIIGALTSNSSAAGIWIGARTNDNTAVIGTRTASGNLAFETYSGGWGERLRITSAGQSIFSKTTNNANDLLFGYGTSTGIYAGIGGFNNFNTNQLCDLTFWTNGSTGSCSPSERMRITSGGFVGINETAPGSQLTVKRANTSTSGLNGVLKLKQGNATNGNRASLLFSSLDDFDVAAVNGVIETHAGSASNNKGRLEFWTKHTGSSISVKGWFDSEGSFFNTTTNHGIYTHSSVGSGTSKYLYRAAHSNGSTIVFNVWSNGNVESATNSFGPVSDRKLKENIVDAESQWADIKSVIFRKFNFKEETGYETHTQLGVIAQELESTSPGLVYETPDTDAEGNDLGTTTKKVKASVLTMKALVALQEAMERIETLEQRLTDAGL